MVNRFSKEPINLVVFGATGDLMARKILPSLFYLYKEKALPENFRVVGVSRRDIFEEGFRERMREAASKFDEIKKDKRLEKFLAFFYFVKGFFGDKYTYEDLKRVLPAKSKNFFYLAVAPKFYKVVLKNIAAAGLINPKTFFLVEKPIGLDLKSAREVENLLAKYFKEKQIYRVDHYLAKEGVQKLFEFRFKEKEMEKIWSRDFVSSVELRLWEEKDATGRGEFYDGVGALRDVGQNHLLAVLAYLAMEKPKNFSGEEIRKARARLLKTLKIYNAKQANNFSYRAQYKGFRSLKGVKRNSKTETFFKVLVFLKEGRFKGVPITIEAGKALPQNRKEAVINFKDKRKIVFPFETHAVKYQYVEEYKKILSKAFMNDDSIFLGKDEVLASWKFVDPIISAFRKKIPLKFYEVNKYPK
ncbi:hypothetical protein A3B18_00100 [Candidatus Giovannonibacteria bacterium RIFCSPLOWO2_01_FULL_46_13]|uniref:Glucose-6-phosphate 1-dehydrogenase n=1 Tax=Candidatus Giovannonibacteria bacterium RIFCSPLOWO2_01_FULL_46_13 TaxID=1798352 RepID=A0A1F5X3D2_9BACT|nr:MAG: hypothetical protein A3B18_00100 [Candidatus Giovannonibacteria bacterium RIFCSPLOWO2_01_FULL_46_13]